MAGRVEKRRKPANKAAEPGSKSTTSRTKANAPPVVDKDATLGSDGVHESDAAVSSTKRGRVDDDREQRVAKKPKTDSKHLQVSTKASGALNQAPTEVCTVLVFGNGDNGELGLGPSKTESLRPRQNPFLNPGDSSKFHVVQIACGGMHTVALTADNKIITWGVNDNCALGRDTTWDEKLRDMDAESGEEEEGELNPLESTPTHVASRHLPADTVFVQVAAGDSCSFALTETGLVYGWGTFRDSKGDERFGYEADGKIIEKQDKPALIRGVQNITQLACGVDHVLALDASGNIWGWGNNEQNQLGRRLFGRDQDSLIPHQIRVCRNNAKYIASGEYHSFAIDKKDNVWSWGLNSFGEAGDPDTAGTNSAVLPYPMKIRTLAGKGITCIDGGAHHSAAVTPDGECFMWGRMDGGQLGFTFTPEQLQDAAQVRFDERNKPAICLRPAAVPHVGLVSHVACGTDHTIFITRDGDAYATGFGSQGQLGLNSEEDVEVAQRVKGRDADEAVLTWAGAGGQFSIVSAPATSG
ncbi:hypothetical protein BN1708_010509 [Verticillium longisporum]|uniref:RCC1-like domain-containing protein n=2 Tax=Verticillium longisporum TaxID=100787 RepID=A0A0G4KRT2_VERLO|nr:hypothetical protein BN1708_010509 [Verticillium longisporum]